MSSSGASNHFCSCLTSFIPFSLRSLRILSYLYPHIHNSSDTGQLARSAVLAVLRILQNDDELSLHVANQSNFCSVSLARGETLFEPKKLCEKATDEDVSNK